MSIFRQALSPTSKNYPSENLMVCANTPFQKTLFPSCEGILTKNPLFAEINNANFESK